MREAELTTAGRRGEERAARGAVPLGAGARTNRPPRLAPIRRAAGELERTIQRRPQTTSVDQGRRGHRGHPQEMTAARRVLDQLSGRASATSDQRLASVVPTADRGAALSPRENRWPGAWTLACRRMFSSVDAPAEPLRKALKALAAECVRCVEVRIKRVADGSSREKRSSARGRRFAAAGKPHERARAGQPFFYHQAGSGPDSALELFLVRAFADQMGGSCNASRSAPGHLHLGALELLANRDVARMSRSCRTSSWSRTTMPFVRSADAFMDRGDQAEGVADAAGRSRGQQEIPEIAVVDLRPPTSPARGGDAIRRSIPRPPSSCRPVTAASLLYSKVYRLGATHHWMKPTDPGLHLGGVPTRAGVPAARFDDGTAVAREESSGSI